MQIHNEQPIILLYPPASDPTQPYSSLPALTGYLRKYGFEVIQRDIGIELFDSMLTPEALSRACDSAAERLNNGVQNDDEFIKRYHNINGISEYIINHIPEARQLMKDEKLFYNLERYQWAVRIISLACELLSLPYHPTVFGPRSYENNFRLSFQSLLDAAQRRNDNLFYDIFENEVVPGIISSNPLLVGISVTYHFQVIPAFTLARLIKTKAPELHVTMGGAIIQEMEEALSADPQCFQFADSYCVGEGETALRTLAAKLQAKEGIDDIPNMILADTNDKDRPISRWYEDMNDLPCPDYDGLDLKRYFSPEPVFLISSARGCYWGRCAFCNVSMNTRSRHRQLEPEALVSNIRLLNGKYGTKRFFFCNDATSPVHMMSMAKLVKEELPDVTWGTEARFEKALTGEFLSMLKEGGCRYLIFGFESASQRVLDIMNKGNLVGIHNDILENCYKNQIQVNLQTFIGFPTETVEEAWETINYLIENEKKISAIGYGKFTLEKDTPVYNRPMEYGIEKIIPSDDSAIFNNYDYVSSIGMTQQDAEREYNLGFERVNKIYRCRSLLLGGVSGSHSLLQSSYFEYDQNYKQWKELEKPGWADKTEIESLVLEISPMLLFSNEHIAFCSKTGKCYELSPGDIKILRLFDGRRTVGDASSYLTDNENYDLKTSIIEMAKTMAKIREFLRNGLVRTIGSSPP